MSDGCETYERGIYRTKDARLSDLAGRKILPIGKDVFPDVIRNNVFVDKSMLIADVLDSGAFVQRAKLRKSRLEPRGWARAL